MSGSNIGSRSNTPPPPPDIHRPHPIAQRFRNRPAIGTKIDTDADKTDRTELFLLGEGEKKVTMELETRKYCTPSYISPTNSHHSPPQASPTQPCSPSTKKTTRWAT